MAPPAEQKADRERRRPRRRGMVEPERNRGHAPRRRPVLFPHQELAFSDLMATASALFGGGWESLPVKPRFNVLLTGGTGLGKTALVRAVAQTLQLPLFEISTATWVLVGASLRGAVATWPSLVEFFRHNPSGIIFVDEIDKIGGRSDWTVYLRSEIFSLLDRKVPRDLLSASADNSYEARAPKPLTLAIAQRRLERGMLIVGAGAFQEFWDDAGTPLVGFGETATAAPPTPDLAKLTRWLPRELTNRFRARVIHLPPLQLSGYLSMLRHTAALLPDRLQEQFLARGYASAAHAVEARLGARWIEELITESLVAIRSDSCGRLASREPPAPDPSDNVR
jgi:SpoVK/Ycf46/Vps4 family AAA+-type ATPase